MSRKCNGMRRPPHWRRTRAVPPNCAGNATGHHTGGPHVPDRRNAQEMLRRHFHGPHMPYLRTCSGNAIARGSHHTGGPHVPCPQEMLQHAGGRLHLVYPKMLRKCHGARGPPCWRPPRRAGATILATPTSCTPKCSGNAMKCCGTATFLRLALGAEGAKGVSVAAMRVPRGCQSLVISDCRATLRTVAVTLFRDACTGDRRCQWGVSCCSEGGGRWIKGE